ncbi:nuclease-related domain-containing protein [Evansella sp. AB-rgal1]|uniref:nuclease-related domain-containing protein n=1 Tax=Evansella sp. AB-rgal1 TaxID=3242696 RepID=UPI00359D33E0
MSNNFFKERTEPYQLKVLNYLHVRMSFTEKEKKYLENLRKGYAGEKQFDLWLSQLTEEYIILNDLLLEVNHSEFQIDSFVISQPNIYVFDVKNLEGDYYIDANGHWFKKPNLESKNHLMQIQRSETLLRQLFQQHNLLFQIKSYLVFVNPEFVLLQANKDLPIIYPNQLQRFQKQLLHSPSKLQPKHNQLAHKMLSLHKTKSSTNKIPEYEYEKLRRGIVCCECKLFSVSVNKQYILCNDCGVMETVEKAIVRNVKEIMFLFPSCKITTQLVFEWCLIIECTRRISRVLKKHFKLIRKGNQSYYVDE